MSNDDENKRPNLPPLEENSPSVGILLADLSDQVRQLTTAVLKFEASRSDNVLELANAVAQQNAGRDRLTEAVLENTRRNTELFDQRDFFVNASNSIHASIDGIRAALNIEKAAEKAIKRATREAVREATDQHRRMSEDEIEGRIGAVRRLIREIGKTSTGGKILLAFLAALLFYAFGMWSNMKIHKDTEEPQGTPIERHKLPEK